MRTFELSGEEATLKLEAQTSGVRSPHASWDYSAHLRGHALQVNLRVSDDDPASFVDFFESIAEDWQGWSETRGYESLDGTLAIAATHDRASSVRFEVRVRADARTGFDWSAVHRMTVGMENLGRLAEAARRFAA